MRGKSSQRLTSLRWLGDRDGADETASHQEPKAFDTGEVGRGDDPYLQAELGLRLEAGRAGGGVQRRGAQRRQV